MKKCKAFRSLLLAAFFVNFCLVSTLFSQVALLDQNSLSDVSITTADGKLALVFKGTIKTLGRADVAISRTEGSNQFTIAFLNSLWDAKDMKPVTRRFKATDPVKNITINNSISKDIGREGMFVLTVDVEGNENLNPELALPISSSEVRILLKGKVTKAVTAQTLAREREEAAKLRAAIQKQKRLAQATAKESVEAILQRYRKPSIMQISIFNASGYSKRAYGLSVYLGKLKKEHIEESLGMKMEIVNISNARDKNHKISTIYFRNNYLKPALFLAKLIKGDQRVVPLPDQEERQGVDIEIYLGKDYK